MKNLYVIVLLLLIAAHCLNAQTVNVSTKVTEVTHNYDCGNDAAGVCCGCWISICDDPEPRWKFWSGHTGSNFQGPVTINGGTRSCGPWNITDTDIASHSATVATQVNFEMESWEEDGCGGDNDYNSGCFPNPDDGHTSRTRLADINFRSVAPCGTATYGFYYGGNGYGGKFSIYWSWAEAPTFTQQPNAGGNFSICPGVPIELSCETNIANGHNMGKFFQWQSSTNNVAFTNISGATAKTYIPSTVTSGTRYYRVLSTSNCSADFASNTATSLSVTVVVKSAADASCNLPTCNAIYVDPINGNDANGTNRPNTPWKTVGKALNTLATNNTTLTYIKVGKGTSTETSTLTMRPYVVIEGGYLPGTGSTDWSKSAATSDITLLSFTNAATRDENNDVRNLTAIYSNNVDYWTVKDLNIETANATGTSINGRGVSNYGFHIVGGSNDYKIIRVDVDLGNASSGAAGSGYEANGGAGGTGGGAGGSGASGGGNPGGGGNGSAGSDGTGGPSGGGTRGNGGLGTDNCGGAGFCPGSCTGNNGGNGTDAGDGSAYAANNRPTTPAASNSAYYTPAGQAESGGGGGGGGRGAGGAGSRGGSFSCVNCSGRDGGDGGYGGAGGGGGKGGFGGGGTFGIWRNSSNVNVTITDVNITIGSAGVGGNGNGGQPTPNTSRNSFYNSGRGCGSCGTNSGRCGGNGGEGGNGGDGGRGRDGANGTTANTVINGATSTSTATIAHPTVYINNGSVKANMPGLICINSEIDLQKTAGNWALPAGMLFIDNLGTGLPSYVVGDNNVKVSVTAANDYDITANGSVLRGFVSVAPTSVHNRTKPNVAATQTQVCVDGSVSLSTSSNYDSPNVIEREWKVYTDAQGPGSPYQSSTGISPVVTFTTAGVYRVRYRERHNCCGWSTPSFQTITVTEDPIAPVLAPSPSDPTICQGGTVSAIVTPGSAGTGCTEVYEYRLDGGTWLPYTSGSSIGSTAANTITVRGVRTCSGVGCTPEVSDEFTWSVVSKPIWLTNTITPTLNCLGGIVTFNATVHGGAGGTITWIRALTPGGTGIVVTSPDYPPGTGTYYYRPVFTTSNVGCSIPDGTEHTIPIVFGTLPSPAAPITGPTTVTFAQTGVVYTTTPVANAVSYDWTVPSGAVIVSGQGTTSIVVDFTTATGGDVVVWPINGLCVGDPDYHTVSVTSLPLVWTGNVDDSWNVTGNWSTNNVPTAADDVLIPVSRPNYPASYTANPVAHKLMIEDGASVTLIPSNDLTVSGDINIYAGGTLEVIAQAGATPDIHITGNWSNIGTLIPATGTVYFDGSTAQTISGTTVFYSLEADNASGISVASGMTYVHGGLNLKSGLITTNNRLTIKSDANRTGWIDDFSPAMNGNVAGDIIMQRFFEASPLFTSFHYISSAVTGTSVSTELSELALYGADGGQIIPAPNCNPNGVAYQSPYGNLFEWRENATFRYNCSQAGWFVRSAGSLTNGRGYAAIVDRTADFILDVKGTFNSGPIAYNGLSNTNAVGDGWHLVSNPYPSPIEWNAPAGFVGAAHLWQSSGSYTGTYQPVLSGVGAEISSMQGFFIQTVGAGPVNFTLDNSDRRTGSPTYLRQANWYDHILNVELAGNNFADKTTIYFGTNATDAWDNMYDAQKKESRANQPTLYTRIANYPKYVGINGLPVNNSAVVSVPMGLLAGTAGTYTLSFTDLATFDPSALIYLEDTKTGTLQNMRGNNTYTFTSTLGDDPERFIIHFFPPTTFNTTDVDCNGFNGKVNVDLGNFNLGGAVLLWDSYELTNNSGNVVASSTNVNGAVNLTNLQAGNYTLTLNIQGYQTTQAITVGAPSIVTAAYDPGFSQAYTQAILEFINQSSNATTYYWSFGDGNTSGIDNPTHIYTQPGVYDVTLVANNDDCSNTYTNKVEVLEVTVGLPGNLDENPLVKITSYGDVITIGFLNLKDPTVNVDIFDLTGRRIIETLKLETSQAKHQIKMSQIASGYYFVRVTGANTNTDEKVLLSSDN